MSDYDDDLPIVVIEKRSGAIGPLIWGALLGAGATLLFAPRSGEETRRELSDGARRLRDSADATLRDVQDSIAASMREMRTELEQHVDAARSAYDAGRSAARGARSDLEQRYSQGRKDVRASYTGAGAEAQVEAGDEQEE